MLRSLSLVIRQLNTSIAVSTLTSGQCRLSPLIQVIQDCSHLYHFTVKLLFKLHACKSSYYILKKTKTKGLRFKPRCGCVFNNCLIRCCGFQVFLLTPCKDTVIVSTTSSTGGSPTASGPVSGLHQSGGSRFYQRKCAT